ncbi:hypothetical protein PEC301879_03480 [Pectobacterium carotovorum subsp. carotovorum]|nr:hypothetical protein PEC301879_03480 [Pectobacterium carotovorum subsp. carotovorum]
MMLPPAQIVTCCMILKQLNQKEGEHVINFEKIILEYSEQYTDFAASTIAFMENQEKKIDADEISRRIPQEKRLFLTNA